MLIIKNKSKNIPDAIACKKLVFLDHVNILVLF